MHQAVSGLWASLSALASFPIPLPSTWTVKATAYLITQMIALASEYLLWAKCFPLTLVLPKCYLILTTYKVKTVTVAV